MNAPRPVSEDDLHAYVDDRLPPGRRAELEGLLRTDMALRRRVEDWRAQRDGLRDALAARGHEAVPAALSLSSLAEARRVTSRRTAALRIAAGVALSLGLGAAGGWMARGVSGPTEIARLGLEAASAYRVYANLPGRAVEVDAANRAELVGWMTHALGRPVAVPDLSAAGYRLLGGRVLAAMYGPAAMLVYEDAQLNRITVYVQPMRRGDPAPMRPLAPGPVDGYAWIDGQVGYGVLSQGDQAHLHAIANSIRDLMRS